MENRTDVAGAAAAYILTRVGEADLWKKEDVPVGRAANLELEDAKPDAAADAADGEAPE